MANNPMRNAFFILFTFALLAPSLFAQQTDSYTEEDPYNVRKRTFFSLNPSYESWAVGDSISFNQISNDVNLYYQLTDNLVMTLRNGQAKIAGTNDYVNQDITELSGIGDVQLSLGYRLSNFPLMMTAGVGLPTGKSTLTREELQTSSLISSPTFDLGVSNLGQGLNISLGTSIAVPLNENFALGIGAAYQIKGAFDAIEGEDSVYDSGDELAVDVGFNARLNATTMFTADALYTLFSEDTYNGDEVFDAGNKLVLALQLRKYIGQNELSILTRYRTREPNALVAIAGDALKLEEVNSNPNYVEMKAQYRLQVSPSFLVALLTEYKTFAETPAPFTGIQLFGAGIAPEFVVGESVRIPIKIKYLTGSYKDHTLSNIDASIGLLFVF